MTIGDLKAWIICDACQEEDEVGFPFVYPNDMLGRNGKGGHYDHTQPRLPAGWRQSGEDKHLCSECREEGART